MAAVGFSGEKSPSVAAVVQSKKLGRRDPKFGGEDGLRPVVVRILDGGSSGVASLRMAFLLLKDEFTVESSYDCIQAAYFVFIFP